MLLGLLPILALVAVYAIASHFRLADNPDDKLLPGLGQMIEAMKALMFEADPRSGRYLFLSDTLASLARLLTGVGLAAVAALLVGVNMGLHQRTREVFGPTLTIVSLIPPLAVLPILFIALGVDEASKVTLIFIGVFPLMARDMLLATDALPREGLVKAVPTRRHLSARRASDAASADRLDQARARGRLAVPHCGRGDRIDRGVGLPDLPRSALPLDGRDPAVCCVDHFAGVHVRLAATPMAELAVPVVRREQEKLSRSANDQGTRKPADLRP
jgi:hypothetical protein